MHEAREMAMRQQDLMLNSKDTPVQLEEQSDTSMQSPVKTQILAYEIGPSLYLNITDRCTLRCDFCPKYRVNCRNREVHGLDLTLQHLPTAEEVIQAMGDPARYWEVVFCGFGEPTLRLDLVLVIADYIKAHGGRVRLNTDGLANLVHKRNVLPSMQGRIDAVSVSMNADTKRLYDFHCRPAMKNSFETMLAFLNDASAYIPEVTATAVDGLEGVDIDACERLAFERGASFRRRVLDEVG